MKQCKRKSSPPKKSGSSSFSMINRDAAGIDIGSGEHWVAVPEDRDEEPVRCFGCFTADLQAVARWLKECVLPPSPGNPPGSTGFPATRSLEEHGFRVNLANARHVKNVPGRVYDCFYVGYLS
jgi:transposase